MSRFIDSLSILNPSDTLRAFARAAVAHNKARSRYDDFHSRLTPYQLDDPTPTVQAQLDRLADAYDVLLGPKIDSERAAIEALHTVGVLAGDGSALLDDKLYLIAEDANDRPLVVVVSLREVVNLQV